MSEDGAVQDTATRRIPIVDEGHVKNRHTEVMFA